QAQQSTSLTLHIPPYQAAPSSSVLLPPMSFPHASAPPDQAAPPAQTAPAQKPSVPSQQPSVLQSPTPQPQQPSGAEQQPPNPPRVSLMGGLLTVAAENSTLADILNAIEPVTHGSLEGTQPDAERVFGQFGPGAP